MNKNLPSNINTVDILNKFKYTYIDDNNNIKTEYFNNLENGIRIICENIILDFYNNENDNIILYDYYNIDIFIIKNNDYEKAYKKLVLNTNYNVYTLKKNNDDIITKTIIYSSYNKNDAFIFCNNYVKNNLTNSKKNQGNLDILELMLIDICSERFNTDDMYCLYKINLLNGDTIIDYDNNKKLPFDLIYLKKCK